MICATANYNSGLQSISAFIKLCQNHPNATVITIGVNTTAPNPPCTNCTVNVIPVADIGNFMKCSAYGDPHYVLLDGSIKHFQGLGAFLFLADVNSTFEVQQHSHIQYQIKPLLRKMEIN